MTIRTILTATAATALICGSPASAQQSSEPGEAQQPRQNQPQAQPEQQGQIEQPATQSGARGERQVAAQCIEDLRAFAVRMDEEGYWLTGWGGRWGYGVEPSPGTAPVPGSEPTAPPLPGTQPGVDRPGAVGVDPGPWGRRLWGMESPSFQIRTLYSAANVLGLRGDEEGCNYLSGELRDLYREYVAQLREAGVEPGEITNWRQEMLVAARPVEELGRAAVNLADVTGTEIRNVQDEHLGTVDDVLLDADGSIRYVVVSRGGFLGIGEEFVAIPWQALQATPGLNTFVLNVPAEVMDQAPKVDPDQFADPQTFARQRDEVDEFWQQHTAG